MSQTTRTRAEAHDVPVTYAQIYVDLAAAHGIDPERLVAHAGLAPAQLVLPAGRLPLRDMLQLVDAALTLTNDRGLGFEVGLRRPLTAHGPMGYALLCAPDYRAALDLLQRFWPVRSQSVSLSYVTEREQLVFHFTPELALPARLRRTLLESVLTSFERGLEFLAGTAALPLELWFDHDEPPYFGKYRDCLPTVRFGMPGPQIRLLDTSVLNRAMPTANSEALAEAVALCERQLALLGLDGKSLLERTRTALKLGPAGYPSAQQLAKQLHTSPRTLRRRLLEYGSSYTKLLEAARQRDSCLLLDNPELQIAQISELLGFNNPANFSRAFKRWSGMAPLEYRCKARARSADTRGSASGE